MQTWTHREVPTTNIHGHELLVLRLRRMILECGARIVVGDAKCVVCPRFRRGVESRVDRIQDIVGA